MAIRAAFGMGVDMAGADRLMMIDKVSHHQAAAGQLRGAARADRPASTDVTHANWFGGIYQDPKNLRHLRGRAGELAADLSREFELPEDQKKAWLADRTGAIVGADTAKQFGWKVGDKCRSTAPSTAGPTAARGSSPSTASTTRTSKGADKTQLLLPLRLPATRRSRDQRHATIGQLVRPPHQRSATGRRRSRRRLDAMFANSPSETKTDTEKAFVADFAKQVGDIGQIMMCDRRRWRLHHPAGRRQHHGAGDARAHQRARGAEDARLQRRTHPAAGAAESCSSPSSAAALGLGDLATSSITLGGDPTHGLLPAFYFPTATLVARRRRWCSRSGWRPASCPPGRPGACASSTRCRRTDGCTGSQIIAVTGVNIRSIRAAARFVGVAVIGIAGVVLVFVAVLSIAEGVERDDEGVGRSRTRCSSCAPAATRR